MSDKIAITGIGGVFPGARDLDEFWQNILNANDAAMDVPADRWHLQAEELYSDTLAVDKINSRRACLIQGFEFDPVGLDIDVDLLQGLDPMYQLVLHAGRAAWQDTKTDRLNKKRVGIIMGNIVLPTESASLFSDELFKALFEEQLFNQSHHQGINSPESRVVSASRSGMGSIPQSQGQGRAGIEPLNRYVAGLPAGLLAQALGLGAGTYTLDAACASSLYSLKYAADELLAGRCDAMLAGGVSRPDCLYTQMGFSQLNAISSSGRCSPFDSKADGLLVGEGAGIFVLKRLSDAVQQGDHVYATLDGIGLSNDIQGNIMSPDSEGQLRAMQAAYAEAACSPDAVQYIECHGTGTPIGDRVEFNSLQQLWQRHAVTGDCVIGSVKSNVGHLLTAAGAAALMKTLLAMKHGVLPPTANYESPADQIDLANSPFRILDKPLPWQLSDGQARRAAISGFGFGGINAHVLLQEYRQEKQLQSISIASLSKPAAEIAIVGMDTCLGPWKNQAEFNHAVLFGADRAATPPDNGWGAEAMGQPAYGIDAVTIPLGRYRIPPAELKEMLPQQLLMLELAANALADAGLSELTPEQQTRTGVFIGIALDMNTTNFHFRWMQKKYARDWLQRLGIQLNDKELNDWIDALKAACGPGLSANRTMGALGGIVASRIARAFQVGGPAFTVAAEETSGLRALGMGMRALQQQELDQVIIGAVDLASDLRAVKAHRERCKLDCVADGATAFILKRHDDARRDGDQIYALIKGIGVASAGACDRSATAAQHLSMQAACAEAACQQDSIDQYYHAAGDDALAIPALQADQSFELGYSGAANGLMAVAGAVSALSQRCLSTNKQSQTRYWLKDRLAGPRRSLVNSSGIDGNNISILLEEADVITNTSADKQKLFLLAAVDQAGLVKRLQSLSFEDECSDQQGEYRVSILAKNADEFNTACQQAIDAINNGTNIHNGPCVYSVAPLATDGKVAFVYPGSGNHFRGMGQDLGLAFPEVLEQLQHENERLASQFAGGRFWSADDGKSFSQEEVIFGQVWLGSFVSDVVSSFDIKPDAIIGYSLGETAGFFSTRTWTARDEMLDRIRQSTLFTEELAGDCTAVQRAWGTDEPVEWGLGVINTDADTVSTVLKKYPRVYLLIINTPTECVIGGDRSELNRVVRELNAQYHPLSGVTTVHCEVARPVAEAYRDLHVFKTIPPEGVTFYSGIRGGAYEVDQDTAADSILDQALEHFDYTRVIKSAYADGVRLFIEMGPGGSCSRMIDQILEDKPHYSQAVCVKGQDSVENVLQLLAGLHAEGVSVEISKLQQEQTNSEYKKLITVQTGGQPFKVPLPSKTARKEAVLVPLSQAAQRATPAVGGTATVWPRAVNDGLQSMLKQMHLTEQARAEAQETFLRVNQGMTNTLADAMTMQMCLLNGSDLDLKEPPATAYTPTPRCKFDRAACLEFATGSIGKMLGATFADIDQHPSRVRLPDEPLMLVDRILDVDAEPDSMSHGRVITEHDVRPGAWYLDLGRIPTCIAVEAGQADLFLSGYLGIDHMTNGHAVYRLLDARITFHAPLPKEGQTIQYDIQIDHFFRQDDTWLFRFNFEGSVNGQALLTMTQGCAGFFSQQELDAGQGIVLSNIEKQAAEGRLTGGYRPLLDMQIESYSDAELNALRQGDLVGCFGDLFANTGLDAAVGLPGGRMCLVHRILALDPDGGRYGIGQITGEADIHPDDWFLICHFVDDKVMPGTLMYECCLHTLRVYLLRMGWIGEIDEFVYEPIIGETSQLKCRGQVIETSRRVQYEITLKEIGYQADGVPYVLADALMYADHRAIVQMKNMSVQLTGLTKAKLETRWQNQLKPKTKTVLFDNASILAFAEGKPSDAFGDRYKRFDKERKIARLPRPPYKFLDRIVSIKDCQQWVLKAGAVIEAEYDVPVDEWYFTEDRQPWMPFAVLLEVALQPCGWLAAYLGSALCSDTDLSFRNLGGRATQYSQVARDSGVLKTRIRMSNVSQSGGMIIQDFDYEMNSAQGLVYKGDTCFGFFSKAALADQVGIRGVDLYRPTDAEQQRGSRFAYPKESPMPADRMRMLDEISLFVPTGGAKGLGYIEGRVKVKPEAWFFKAHFYQDPVWPGSLGLESFQQLLKVFAWERWQDELAIGKFSFESMALDQEHQWVYRGQILPGDDSVTVQAVITGLDDQSRMIKAEGFLSVDGRIIYQMKDFTLRINPL